MEYKRIKKEFIKTIFGFKQILPVMIGIIMLISLSLTLIPNNIYKIIFTGNNILDTLIGGVLGSISTGNPITSYIIGGTLKTQNVSMIVITSFILTWVSVGMVQLPAESLMLGKRFAITRNILSFIMALLLAFIITFIITII